jgi:hypothetical protein
MDFELLFNAVEDEDFITTEEVLEDILEDNDSITLVEKILLFMEEHPDIDYGMPGPLVHYVERYFLRGYEQLLYDSIKRKPTIHTLWMLNRILNSPKLDESEKYISLMREVSNDKNIDESLRNEAKEYWDYQNR